MLEAHPHAITLMRRLARSPCLLLQGRLPLLLVLLLQDLTHTTPH